MIPTSRQQRGQRWSSKTEIIIPFFQVSQKDYLSKGYQQKRNVTAFDCKHLWDLAICHRTTNNGQNIIHIEIQNIRWLMKMGLTESQGSWLSKEWSVKRGILCFHNIRPRLTWRNMGIISAAPDKIPLALRGKCL